MDMEIRLRENYFIDMDIDIQIIDIYLIFIQNFLKATLISITVDLYLLFLQTNIIRPSGKC